MSNFKIKEKVSSSLNSISDIPSGSIISTIVSSSTPDGWVECNGQELLIGTAGTTYYNLYLKCLDYYGAYTNGSGGSGSTHFVVPNLASKYLVPRITTDTNAYSGGSNSHRHLVTAAATSNNVAVNHYHNIGQNSYGGDYYAHNHSGSAGDNNTFSGSNPGNRNKTGTGGSGYAAGAAHIHAGSSAANTGYGSVAGHGAPTYSYHNIGALGISSSNWAGHTHNSSSTNSNSISGYTEYVESFNPSYVVRYLIKV